MPDFLLRQRWYPAKDAGRPAAEIAQFVPVPCGSSNAAIAIWDVTPPRGPPLTMFVPLMLAKAGSTDPRQTIATTHTNGGEGAHIVEAFSDDAFVRAWLALHFAPPPAAKDLHAALRVPAGEIEWKHAPIKRSSAEQSNTSLRVGNGAILKVIRKLEGGPHPELEIGRFLSEAGFSATPALLGWVELAANHGSPAYALTLLQRFVPNDGDGWSWTLDQLARAMEQGESARLEHLSRWIERLAMQTAEMHRAFAMASGDPSFRPDPVTTADLQNWQTAALAMAARAFDGLQHHLRQTALRQAQQLLDSRDDVQQRLRAILNVRPEFYKTRHHGDFHLGQVLVADGDAVILDFEGEPLRPLQERRAKHCVLRDVAGIVRSFSYAAEAAFRALPQDVTEPERKAKRARLDTWRADASRVFVETYFAAAQELKSIPPERSEAEQVLSFFVLEKALYEVAYELANRPDWLEIPLHGVLSMCSDGR